MSLKKCNLSLKFQNKWENKSRRKEDDFKQETFAADKRLIKINW